MGSLEVRSGVLTLPDGAVVDGIVQVSPGAGLAPTRFSAAFLAFDGATSWAGSFDGAGSLRVTGGTLTLASPQFHTGETSVDTNAVLVLDAGASVATSRAVVVDGTLDMTAADQMLPRLQGGGDVLIGARTLFVQTGGGLVSSSVEVIGTGDVVVNGPTSWRVEGAWPSFTGTLQVASGSVELGVFATQGVVDISVAGAVQVNVSQAVVSSLSGTGALDIGVGGVLDVRENGSGRFSGTLNAQGQLQFSGTGTFTLDGSAAAGNVAVLSGTVVADVDLSNGDTYVASGASLRGTGIVRGQIDGTLMPGNGVGVLGGRNLSLSSTAVLRCELGATSDRLDVQGFASVGGTLELVALPSFAPLVGDEIVLVTNDGTDPLAGTFQYAQGQILRIAGHTLQVSYTGGDGNDLSLRAVAPFLVTSTAATGPGSLAQAILDTNANPGADVIEISPLLLGQVFPGTLPAITDTMSIDSGGNPPSFGLDPNQSLITQAPLTLPDGTVIAGRLSLNGATAALSNTTIQASELRFSMTSASYVWGGSLLGAGDLRVDGGTITLTAPQTYTGTTTVADRLVLASTASLAASSNVEVDGASTLDISAGDQTLRGLTGTGTVQLGASTLTLNTSAPILSSVQIAGGGDVVVNAGSSLTFTSSQLFTGTLSVATGLVLLQGGFAGAADLGATGVLRFQNNADVTGLSGTGILTVDAGQTLTVRESGTSTFAGDLSGAGTVAVTGGGTLVLQGGAGTFAGAVTVDGATLRADADLAHVGVDVGNGGVVSGTGTVQATVQAGGTLAPGNGIGSLGVVDLDVQAGGTVRMELGATTDRITALGTVTLNGALALTELAGFAPANGVPIVLIDNDGTDAVVGTFAGLADGATVTIGARTAVLDYDGGDGNDVTLTFGAVMPPPPPPPPPAGGAPLPNIGIVATASPLGGVLRGTPYDDTLTGLGGADVFVPLAGRDGIDGGAGTDSVLFDGLRSSYTIARGADGVVTVTPVADPGSADRIINVEKLVFDNGAVLLAPSSQQALVSCLYGALLGRRADEGGLGFHVDAMLAGTSLHAIALGFLHSPELAAQPARSAPQVIASLYEHFLGRVADAGGLAYHTADHARYADARDATAQLLANFAASPEMQVRLVALASTGIDLLPA